MVHKSRFPILPQEEAGCIFLASYLVMQLPPIPLWDQFKTTSTEKLLVSKDFIFFLLCLETVLSILKEMNISVLKSKPG